MGNSFSRVSALLELDDTTAKAATPPNAETVTNVSTSKNLTVEARRLYFAEVKSDMTQGKAGCPASPIPLSDQYKGVYSRYSWKSIWELEDRKGQPLRRYSALKDLAASTFGRHGRLHS